MKLEFCSKCVVNNLRPVTVPEHLKVSPFDNQPIVFENGICPACRWAEEKKTIDWDARWKKLQEVCDNYRASDHSYDVIVPSSGGKDSRYVAHLLKDSMGMNPITVTWEPNLWTADGTSNFRSQTDCDIPNILVSPPRNIHKKLTTEAFFRLGHPFQPFSIGQKTLAPRAAMHLGIPFIMYGENVAEYTNNPSNNYKPDVDKLIFTSFHSDPANYRIAGLGLSDLSSLGIPLSALNVYSAPPEHVLEQRKLTYYYMSFFVNWHPLRNYYYAFERTGFVPAQTRKPGTFCRYSGLDDYIEELHFYLMLCKFGNGRATWDACQEIRSGNISRDDGVLLVRQYETEFPFESLDNFLNYFECTEEKFFRAINSFRNPHLWRHSGKGSDLDPSSWQYLGYVH